MSFISRILSGMERSSAGSEETARAVLAMCGGDIPRDGSVLFVGDECVTARVIAQKLPQVCVGMTDEARLERAVKEFPRAMRVQPFELPHVDGGYDFVWYAANVEFEPARARLSQLREAVKRGGTAVFRALCWLIDPSPDTAAYCAHRFGKLEHLDEVLREAKEQGFTVCDFYIAPKSDWTNGFYRPLLTRAEQYEGQREEYAEIDAGLREIKREADMFELHCEEYSYVYYILKG